MNNEPHDPSSDNPANPGDPWLDSLLDEALAPEVIRDSIPGGPGGLADRIFEATRHRLVRKRRTVLARIGPAGWNAIAAAVVLATGAGVWFAATNLSQHPQASRDQVALGSQPLVPEAQAWPGETPVDQDLTALSLQVEHSQSAWTTASGFDAASDDADDADVSRASSVF